MKILVAEDMRVNQLIIRRVLSSGGYEVVVADNGRIALEQLQDGTFDLLITDISMPEMDGFGLVQAVRESSLALPIVMLTSTVDEVHEAEANALSIDAYLTRPFDSGHLLELIESLLNSK